MNGSPPPIPSAPARKSGLPTWAIVLIVLGIVGVIGIAVIGMLATIAIPNFVRARETAQMNACINNLRQLDGAKRQWALEHNKELTDTPTEDDVATHLQGRWFPICPAGGSYTINPVGADPTCSVPKHQLTSSTPQTTR